MKFKTKQEEFWSGRFGKEYISRNKGKHVIANNIAMFAQILSGMQNVTSILELGANIGLNLIAIHQILPKAELSAVKINKEAYKELSKVPYIHSYLDSILSFKPKQTWDLVFTKGVLIHINPDYLDKIYQLMYDLSRKYILVCEYYNPSPVEVEYRGHKQRLFKRDFAGEILQKFAELNLIDYGFIYRKDPNFPQDDLTWFLLQKK